MSNKFGDLTFKLIDPKLILLEEAIVLPAIKY